MQEFDLERAVDTIITKSGERYPLDKLLGKGTYGRVLSSGNDKIVKILNLGGDKENNDLIQEVTIQQLLAEKEPGVCPKIYTFGYISATKEHAIVMERCEGTALSLFNKKPTKEDFLDYYEQIAKIMQRLEKYQFNHRDLKSDNIMYKTDPATGKKQFLLIDFGFSCITVDGKQYAGTAYFPSTAKCFRRSRDLAQLVFESLVHTEGVENVTSFAQLVLTFNYKGNKCDMSRGCPPDFDGKWKATYDFLDKDGVENPNTTPEGLLKAVTSFRQGGLVSCRSGFVVWPDIDMCVPLPGKPAAAALKPAESPKPHLASPVVSSRKTALKPAVSPKPATASPAVSSRKTARRKKAKSAKLKDCPPGEVRHPITRRCRKEKAIKPCPPGEVRNPATGRCKKSA